MDDRTLFAIGCGVMFLFLAGGYVLVRVTFSAEAGESVDAR
jgi:hypothetical protein